jgi:hypothetical protein
MIVYKVFFSWTGSTTWTQKPFGQKNAVEIPPLGHAVWSSDVLMMSATTVKRLWENMKTFGGQAQFDQNTVVRYEYWKSEDHPSAWSLNRNAGLGMRTAGLTEYLQGNHRIVICHSGMVRMNRSIVILRATAFLNNLPFVVHMENLVDDIRENAKPEKGAGTGDAVETFLTDVFAPLAGIIV